MATVDERRDQYQLQLNEGQLLFGTIRSLSNDKSSGWVKTGIPFLDVKVEGAQSCSVGDSLWLKIRKNRNQNGRTLCIVYDGGQRKPVNVGDLVLGCIDSADDSCCSVKVTPNFIVNVTNYRSAYRTHVPRCGDLCAVRITNLTPNHCEVLFTGERYFTNLDRRRFSVAFPIPDAISPDEINMPAERVCFPDVDGKKLDSNSNADRARARELISLAYSSAVRSGVVIFESNEEISFPLDVYHADEQADPPIFIGLQQDKLANEAGRWFVSFSGKKGKNISKVFNNHVYVADIPKFYADLMRLAIPEQWRFHDSVKDYEILENYFLYTYFNTWIRGLMADATDPDDGTVFRIFNTGLVNYRYEAIYCVLEKHLPTAAIPHHWKFAGFAVVGDSETSMGKLVNKLYPISKLPGRVQYISKLEDLYLDHNANISTDYTHIVVDNADRLPPDVFLEEAPHRSYDEISTIVNKLKSTNTRIRNEGVKEIKAYISSHHSYKLSLVRLMQDAEHRARVRAEWNYKTAVPVYYPAKHCISLLLPLKLLNADDPRASSDPDVALVVSRLHSGNYQGETIFTLRMAYLDSRLITRPDSDWLAPDSIDGCTNESDDD